MLIARQLNEPQDTKKLVFIMSREQTTQFKILSNDNHKKQKSESRKRTILS